MKNAYLGYAKAICMPDHASANCRILTDYEGNTFLLSYSTIVCVVRTDGWMHCNGLYSRTTIKHIGWFMRYISAQFGAKVSYYDAKWCYEHDSMMNVTNGEVLTYEEWNEKEKQTA